MRNPATWKQFLSLMEKISEALDGCGLLNDRGAVQRVNSSGLLTDLVVALALSGGLNINRQEFRQQLGLLPSQLCCLVSVQYLRYPWRSRRELEQEIGCEMNLDLLSWYDEPGKGIQDVRFHLKLIERPSLLGDEERSLAAESRFRPVTLRELLSLLEANPTLGIFAGIIPVGLKRKGHPPSSPALRVSERRKVEEFNPFNPGEGMLAPLSWYTVVAEKK